MTVIDGLVASAWATAKLLVMTVRSFSSAASRRAKCKVVEPASIISTSPGRTKRIANEAIASRSAVMALARSLQAGSKPNGRATAPP